MKTLAIFLLLFLAFATITTIEANCATAYCEADLARLHKFVNTIYNATLGCDDALAIDTINRPYNDDQAIDMARHGLFYADEKASRTVKNG